MTQYPALPRLSIVVCTYDRYDRLPGAVESLRRQKLDEGTIEVVVIDNSPDQAKAARMRELFARDRPDVRYLLEPTPGLSHARNAGTEHAHAGIVAFVDDDAIVAPDWAAQILRAFDDFGGRVGVVGGRVLPRWESPRPSWLPDSLLGYLSILDWGGEGPARELRANEWLVGCNIAFDKELLVSLGGFSRALGRVGAGGALLSSEEIDIIEQLQRSGWPAVYCPKALVHHIIEPSRLTRAWFRRRSAWQAVSEFIKDPERVVAYAPAAVEHVRSEFADRSRASAAGFGLSTDNPETFKRDAGIAYDLTVMLLTGGAEVDAAGRLTERIPLRSKLTAQARKAAQASPALRRVLHQTMRIVPNRVRIAIGV